MRQRSLVAFTVLGQAAAGLRGGLGGVRWGVGPAADAWLPAPLAVTGAVLLTAALAAVPHLGTPGNAWRALSGLRSSWLSRELLALGTVTVCVLALVALHATGTGGQRLRGAMLLGTGAVGMALVYAMARVYRLRTVPVWDSALTTVRFFLTALVVGSLAVGAILGFPASGVEWAASLRWLALAGAWGLTAELVLGLVLRRHWRRVRERVDPGLWARRADEEEPRLVSRATVLRATALLAALAAAAVAAMDSIGVTSVPVLLTAALLAAFTAELGDRAAFYGRFARAGV